MGMDEDVSSGEQEKYGQQIFLYPDGIGYVKLLDVMGDQYTPAEDARTSTNKGRLGPEKDTALQRRLIADNHTSPFEGVLIKFEICVPLFVLRELDRHRTVDKIADEDVEVVTPDEAARKWFARNEMSGRYVEMPNLYYHPDQLRAQSRTNKQGGADGQEASEVVNAFTEEFIRRGKDITRQARELYSEAVEKGVEKGLARIYNTQSQYTKIRMTGSLKNWMDFLRLRLPGGVLWECRRVAQEIENFLLALFPAPMLDWRKHVYDTVVLNRDEIVALRNLIGRAESGWVYQWGDEITNSALKKIGREKQ